MDYAALHQGNMPPRRKNSTSKITKKTAKNTPTDSDLQKNIDNMQKDLRKQREAFDKKQEELNKLKDDLDTKNNKLQKIKQTNEKLKSEKEQIAEENEELKQENREIKEELNQIYNENDRLSASILDLQGELQQTKQKIEQLEQDNYNQRGEIRRLKTSNQDRAEQLVATQTSTQQDHQNICYVGDSNMIMIHAYIEMENMQQYDLIKTFTIEEAISWANTTATSPNTLHLTMVGTNNIKRGETANQCATKHAELTETLDNNGLNYKIIQLPPSYRNSGRDTHFCSRETIKLNITLAQRHNTISMEEIETDRNLIAHDGIHLTDGACMMISTTITKECLTTTAKDRDVRYDEESIRITVQDSRNRTPSPTRPQDNKDRKPNETTTEIITTDKSTAARIIGKKGATIINIKETTGAEINRIENLDETSFIVKGSNKSVTQAMKLIETITRNVNSIPPPTEKRNTICRFYTNGSCKFGNRCIFLHQEGPLDISNPSPEHDHPEDPPSRDLRHKERKDHRGIKKQI